METFGTSATGLVVIDALSCSISVRSLNRFTVSWPVIKKVQSLPRTHLVVTVVEQLSFRATELMVEPEGNTFPWQS